jgi:hypothetical protein
MKTLHLVAAANEFGLPPDQTVLPLPFGDYPYGRKTLADGRKRYILQRIDAASVPHLRSALANAKARGSLGVPVYAGHPDVEELAAKYPDKRSWGWITDYRDADDGLALQVAWNDAPPGRAFLWHSPFWIGPILADDGSTAVMHVREIKSLGLTNDPNIHAFRVPNERAGHEENEMELSRLIELLGLPGDSDQAAVEAALATLREKAGKADAKETEASAAKAEADTAKDEAQAANTALANERTARAEAVIDLAIAEGRLPKAERDAQVALFGKDFEAANTALQARKPVLKTREVSKDIGKRASGQASRQTEIVEAVNEARKAGLGYDDAFAKVKTQHPDWFAAAG